LLEAEVAVAVESEEAANRLIIAGKIAGKVKCKVAGISKEGADWPREVSNRQGRTTCKCRQAAISNEDSSSTFEDKRLKLAVRIKEHHLTGR
jgi:hypothetical protein